MGQLVARRLKRAATVNRLANPKDARASEGIFERVISWRIGKMNSLIELTSVPGLETARAAQIGRKLVVLAFGMKALNGPIAIALMLVLGVVSASAQTPTGSFFNGNSSQLGNSLRSVTFFLAAAMIIAGIIFIAYGIITSGLKESLSTWKFITGAACFAFGGVCAAIYAFSQGDTVPLDNQF